jgi:hypothetical protein
MRRSLYILVFIAIMGCSEDEGVFYPSESPEMFYCIKGLKSHTPECDGVVLSLVYSGGFENKNYDPVFILGVSKKTAEDNAFYLGQKIYDVSQYK